MFYFIYLFSSLILICNNFAESIEDVPKIKWACVNEKCDSPILDFVTTSSLSIIDHSEKLKYVIGAKGSVLKKPKDNFDYYFAQINGIKGYIKKDSIREVKSYEKNPKVTLEDFDPFRVVNDKPREDKLIKPSPPSVIHGTTLYNNEINESDNPKIFPPSNNVETTPLNHNGTYKGFDNNTESTLSDSVDINLGKQTGTEGGENKLPSASEKEPYKVDTLDSLSSTVPSESDKSNADANKSNKDSKAGVGVGSSTPVDNFDDDVDLEDVNDDDEDLLDEQSLNQNEDHDSYIPSSNLDMFKKDTQPSEELGRKYGVVNKPSLEPVMDKPDIVSPKATQQPENTDDTVKQPNESHVDTPEVIPGPQLPPGFRDSLKQDTPVDSPTTYSGPPAEIKDPLHSIKENFVMAENAKEPAHISDSTNEQVGSTSSSNDTSSTLIDTNKQVNDTSSSNNTVNTSINTNDQLGMSSSTNQVESLTISNEKIDVSKNTNEEGNISKNLNENTLPKDTNQQDDKNIKPESFYTNQVEDKQKDTDNMLDSPEPSSPDQQAPSIPEVTLDESKYYSEESPAQSVDHHISKVPSDENIENTTPSTQEESNNSEQIITETFNENIVEAESSPDDSASFYAPVLSLYSSLIELFNKSGLNTDHAYKPLEEKNLDVIELPSVAPPGYCRDTEECGGLERPIAGEDQFGSRSNLCYSNADKFSSSVPLSFNSIIYICITSLVILLFSLGYYYIDKSQNSSSLVAKVNQLSQELFVTKKERDTLEDQLLKVKESCTMMDSSKLKQDSKLTSLEKAYEESESERLQLEETVSRLEKEVETLMDQGMEMHTLLSDTISEEERSQMLLANIGELKESLSEKLNEIVTLTNQLDKKNEEIQLSQIDIRNANDRINDLERKLESRKVESEESFTKKLDEQRQQNIKLQKLIEEKGVSIAKLENELAKTKIERDSAEARASSAETGLQSAHSVGAGEARQAWLDATAVRADLATSNKQNETLQQHMSEVDTNNKILQDKLSSLNEELSSLNLKYESVEKEKVNALTKLQVLSDYFKEKETKLQEELGVKESQWLQKETEDHTIYEQMKSLREEIASYKAQNDKLKGEILEQEASYKVQIANEKQKSYDNWVALRQAERKAKELQMESAHFRNRLTQLETANNQSTVEALNPNGLDKSSFSAPSPPFMMLPPPPADFFSLPPPPLNPSASRPPPLGRISSPQLSGEMIPPPPLVPFDMYPPPSSTPPPPFPIYKPQPRDRPPPPKDSPPSNYSSESVNDKTHRRRRR